MYIYFKIKKRIIQVGNILMCDALKETVNSDYKASRLWNIALKRVQNKVNLRENPNDSSTCAFCNVPIEQLENKIVGFYRSTGYCS